MLNVGVDGDGSLWILVVQDSALCILALVRELQRVVTGVAEGTGCGTVWGQGSRIYMAAVSSNQGSPDLGLGQNLQSQKNRVTKKGVDCD